MTQIFLNLPVKDLNKSIEFFTKLGYTFNSQFTNESATCMIVSETIYVMLLVETFFESFTTKKITDTKTSVEAIIALSADSKEKVNEFVDKAVAAGANIPKDPQDHGFMFTRTFEDLDGHIWEIGWMDMDAFLNLQDNQQL